MIGPLPEAHGNNAIMVFTDRLTKQIHLEAVTTEISSEGLARLMVDRIIRYHGLPKKIISERAPVFISKFMKELYSLLGVQRTPSMAYHPQTDG